jgi:hypothetical protein
LCKLLTSATFSSNYKRCASKASRHRCFCPSNNTCLESSDVRLLRRSCCLMFWSELHSESGTSSVPRCSKAHSDDLVNGYSCGAGDARGKGNMGILRLYTYMHKKGGGDTRHSRCCVLYFFSGTFTCRFGVAKSRRGYQKIMMFELERHPRMNRTPEL